MNTQKSLLEWIGRSLILAAALSSTATVAEAPEGFPRPELPAPSSKENLELTYDLGRMLLEANLKSESHPNAAVDKDKPGEKHALPLANDAKPASRPEVAAKPKTNSLSALFDCYKFARSRFHTTSYPFSSLSDPGDGSNRFEAWSGISVKLGNERGVLLRDGEKTYLISIPSNDEFERRLVLPPMKSVIIRGKWQQAGFAQQDPAFSKRPDGKEFAVMFVPKKFYFEGSVNDVAPVYAKRLIDSEPTVLAAFQKTLDDALSLYRRDTVNTLTKMNSGYVWMERGKDALRRLGDPGEFLSQLNACSEMLAPNNEKTKGFHSDLNRVRKLWKDNYTLLGEIDNAERTHRRNMREMEKLFQSNPDSNRSTFRK